MGKSVVSPADLRDSIDGHALLAEYKSVLDELRALKDDEDREVVKIRKKARITAYDAHRVNALESAHRARRASLIAIRDTIVVLLHKKLSNLKSMEIKAVGGKSVEDAFRDSVASAVESEIGRNDH